MRYLKRINGLGIWYLKDKLFVFKGFFNIDSAGCIDDMKSTSGYVFSLGSSSTCWNSKKREVVAQSTTKVEYIATSTTVNQAIWLQNLLANLGHKQKSLVELYCDNQSAIAIVHNPVQHKRINHIKIKFHAIR